MKIERGDTIMLDNKAKPISIGWVSYISDYSNPHIISIILMSGDKVYYDVNHVHIPYYIRRTKILLTEKIRSIDGI